MYDAASRFSRSHEEAEAEAARLSAQMNSDLSCKAKFAYEARELPPALLYRRAGGVQQSLHRERLIPRCG